MARAPLKLHKRRISRAGGNANNFVSAPISETEGKQATKDCLFVKRSVWKAGMLKGFFAQMTPDFDAPLEDFGI